MAFHRLRLSMENYEQVSIVTPPHSELCFCFELGLYPKQALAMIRILGSNDCAFSTLSKPTEEIKSVKLKDFG